MVYNIDMGATKTRSSGVRCSGMTKRNERCKLCTHNADGYCDKHRVIHQNPRTQPVDLFNSQVAALRHTVDGQKHLLTGELLDLLMRLGAAQDEVRDLNLSYSERQEDWEVNPPRKYGNVVDTADNWYDSIEYQIYQQKQAKAIKGVDEAISDLRHTIIQHLESGPKAKAIRDLLRKFDLRIRRSSHNKDDLWFHDIKDDLWFHAIKEDY